MNFLEAKKRMDVLWEIEVLKYGLPPLTRPTVTETQGEIFHRFFHILSGSAKYQSKTKDVLFKAGSLYILPTDTPYSLHTNHEKTDCLYFGCVVTPNFSNDLIELPVPQDSLLLNFLSTFRILISTKKTDSFCANLLCYQIFHEIEGMLSLQYVFDKRIAKAIRIINQKIDQKISVTNLARECALDPAYFSRLFKKVAKCSPMEFILKKKIDKAVELIEKNETLRTISEAISFSNEKELSRMFKKIKGITVREYKNIYQQEV